MNTINKGVNSLISACLYNEESIIEITFIFIKTIYNKSTVTFQFETDLLATILKIFVNLCLLTVHSLYWNGRIIPST